MHKDCFPSTRSIICQFTLCVSIMEFKCGALSPQSSMSPIRAERLTLSFPFKLKSKIILFASFTNSLSSDIKLVRYKKIGIIKVLTV